MIEVKRAYDPAGENDGLRYLVDRLWPRGLKKETLRLDGWLKEVAPSGDLRRWFAHDPTKWREFRRRYFAELDALPQAWRPILQNARRGKVTLLFSAKDTARNNAVALMEYLNRQLRIAPAAPRRQTLVGAGR
jgi:uncharacterized protein YeaO (DUF488 family)